ncbi:serpin B3-like [Sitodiplosis mosellana]|uniref:serpin B3-like n=1 Tax=Sitodiplosis mosellana TaxID=263140 RepID=UPI0024439D59|nr:serpin B3-like [Sitodiplosis mosellana]
MASSKHENELSTGLSKFALDLYSECAHSSDQNVVISPLSVANVLTLLSQAANGKTYDELRRALHLNADKAVIAHQFAEFSKQIEDCIGKANLSIVNQIYVQQGMMLNSDYRDIAMKNFGAGIEPVDFDKPHETAQTINQFVKEKTMGKIPNAVKPEVFGGNTCVVLVNAISFKANWCRKFATGSTRTGDFYISESDTTQVQYMTHESYFNYTVLDELDATALQIGYKESEFSFVVILPNTRLGLSELESRLKNYDLSKVINRMSKKLVDVKLPRFKYEYEVQLNSILQKMGMSEMFKPKADLQGMLDPSMAGLPLIVSTVLHKAVIEVNERGTEATAFTRADVYRCARSSDSINFNVDHPFFFFIGSATLSTPVFCGSVHKPEASIRPRF